MKLFLNIEKGDYEKPFLLFQKYYKDVECDFLHDYKFKGNNYDMIFYIMSRPFVKLAIDFKIEPEMKGHIFYKTEFDFTQNMLYMIDFHLSVLRENTFKKRKEISCLIPKKNYKIIVSFFEDKLNIRNNNALIKTQTHNETIELAQTLLNYNSIEMLRIQLFDDFILMNEKNKEQLKKIKLLKTIFSKLELIDLQRFLIISGTVLWSYGLRYSNDVDGVVSDNPEPSKLFEKTVLSLLINKDKEHKSEVLFDFYWHVTLDNENELLERRDNILRDAKIQNSDEQFFDPRNYYYFLGLKFSHIDIDIIKRQYRMRPRPKADLIAIKTLLFPGLKLYPITENIGSRDRFLNTIKWALKERYNINYSIEEIKKYITFKY